MNTGLTVGITLGSVAVLAALAGGGYYLYQQSQKPQGQAQPVTPVSPQTPLPQPQQPAPAQVSTNDLLAELQRQQAADAARLREAEIRGFVDRIAAVENLQILELVKIDSVNENAAPREDFRQAWLNEQINSGRFAQMVEGCKRAVTHNCGADWSGGCRGWGHPRCESRETVTSDRFPGAWTNGRDRGNNTPNPWGFLNEESQGAADERVRAWAKTQRRPFEARLAELEIQYRGMVEELKRRYGMDYTPAQANAHTRAAPLVAAGLGQGNGYTVA